MLTRVAIKHGISCWYISLPIGSLSEAKRAKTEDDDTYSTIQLCNRTSEVTPLRNTNRYATMLRY